MLVVVEIPYEGTPENTALSTISGTSPAWLLDSACCNHMTSSPDVVPSHTSTSLPTIYTANGSPMHVSHLGNVFTPALSVSNVYQIPKLTHNLFSVGQLTELGFSLTFSSTGVADSALYSTSVLERATTVCFLFLQEIRESPRRKQYLVVDR